MKEEIISSDALKPGAHVNILFQNEYICYRSTIVKVDKDTFMITYLKDDKGEEVIKQLTNTPTYFEYTDQNGQYRFNTRLISYANGFYRFEKPKQIIRTMSRKYRRFKVNITTENGIIKDISAAGALITSFIPLQINNTIEIKLGELIFTGTVVREQGTRNYGIKFINLTENHLKYLVKLINDHITGDKNNKITFLYY